MPLSPKLQNRFVIVPVLVSVKVTVNGVSPLVGAAVKLAEAGIAPVPITQFVESPPSPVKISSLVKTPSTTGAKLTVAFVPVPPGIGTAFVPPPKKGAVTLLSEPLTKPQPRFVTVKLMSLVVPTATAPK